MKRYDLSKIMRRAWEIKHQDEANIFGLCLRMAWEEAKMEESKKVLKGSDKQIAWAQDIIDGAYMALDAMDRNATRLAKFGCAYNNDDVKAVREWLTAQLAQVDDAAAIISIRTRIDQAGLEKLAKINHKAA